MACYIGTTGNPMRRMKEHEGSGKFPGMRNFRLIHGPIRNLKEAHLVETRLAQRYGCHAHLGGLNGKGPWYVYRFEY